MRRAVSWSFALGMLCASPCAWAGGTRAFELAGYPELDNGELDGTVLTSRGEVALGLEANRLATEGIGMVWSSAVDEKGTVYLGTGLDGAIYRVEQGKAVLVAQTGQLVVTSLVFDAKGDLLAATLPEPTVWRIEKPASIRPGKPVVAKSFAKLPKDVKHLWALYYSKAKRTLYVGTGPLGQLFAIGADGAAHVYADTKEEHVLSLAESGGSLLAGTSPGALLLRVDGPGKMLALADYDATEIKAIALRGKDIYVAVNKFKTPPALPSKASVDSSSKSSSRQEPGEGRIAWLSEGGRNEELWADTKSHVLALALVGERVLAGLAMGGRVVSVDRERIVRTELDLEEREVMSLSVFKDALVAVGTGDAGNVYRVEPARAAEATYLAAPLDAERVARFGRLRWSSRGQLAVSTRTGNTVVPDDSWSDYTPVRRSGDEVKSPAARYLQVRFSWAPDSKAILESCELWFRPVNERAVITAIGTGSPFPEPRKIGDSDSRVSKRTVTLTTFNQNENIVELTWKVDNLDGDTLRYHLWYRAVGQTLWRPILRESDVHLSTKLKWDVQAVPEGKYQVRVAADDSPDNEPKDVLRDEMVSVPFIIDNQPPRVDGLVCDGRTLRGRAIDGFSEIAALEYAVDNEPWMPVAPSDAIFDETTEEFSFAFPAPLLPGPHAVAVRAYDRAGNSGTAELHMDVATVASKRPKAR
ncbi:MAG: hypothetical protein MUC50_07665 [Myxococcota bacterium]|jgi:hypothetical protein|nr:hypothetical protein [Myxococcota bacterium]